MILALAHASSPHAGNEAYQRATWASIVPEDIEVRWLRGDPSRLAVDDETGRCIVVPIPDTPENALAKTVAGIRFALDRWDFDFLLRTNTSSYLHLATLASEVEALGRAGVYRGAQGVVDVRGADVAFVSGAAALFSRDVAQLVADMPVGHWSGSNEDVAIGAHLGAQGVMITPAPRVDVSGGEPIRFASHVRVKSPRSARVTTQRMVEVHEMFTCVHGGALADLIAAFDRREVGRMHLERAAGVGPAAAPPGRAAFRSALRGAGRLLRIGPARADARVRAATFAERLGSFGGRPTS